MLPVQSNPYQGLLANALAETGVEVILGEGPSRFPVLPLVAAWLRAGRPPVLHLHWTHRYLQPILGLRRPAAWRTIAELRLLRRAGVRIVWTVHNVGAHGQTRDDAEQAVHRAIVAQSDAVICHCEAARTIATDAYELPKDLRDRLHVIPHGHYVGVYQDTMSREDARAALGAGPDDRVLVFLGQIRPYKGVDGLVDVFRAIDRPGSRLVIAGRTSSHKVDRRLTRRIGGDPRILFVPGMVPDALIQVYLRGADVAVLPYRDVLTSGSAILALSFGLPVVAPGIGCLPETLDSCSILYDSDAPDGLQRALEEALTTDLAPLAEQAARTAATLDWRSIAERTAELYRG
jgi:glycosyltransferase involved in cell wall biosynthesis